MVKILRCQNHVLISTHVALMIHCGSAALIQSWKMEWSPVRSVSPHGIPAVLTHPTLYESNPVLEITTFMSLSGQWFVELIVQVKIYPFVLYILCSHSVIYFSGFCLKIIDVDIKCSQYQKSQVSPSNHILQHRRSHTQNPLLHQS